MNKKGHELVDEHFVPYVPEDIAKVLKVGVGKSASEKLRMRLGRIRCKEDSSISKARKERRTMELSELIDSFVAGAAGVDWCIGENVAGANGGGLVNSAAADDGSGDSVEALFWSELVKDIASPARFEDCLSRQGAKPSRLSRLAKCQTSR